MNTPLNGSDDAAIKTQTAGGFIALGYNGNALVVFSHSQGRVIQLRDYDISKMTLTRGLGADW